MNHLLNTLGQFTTAVTSLASTNVQRELAEKKVARQKTELDRWRKHHSSFTSLAEEHEREMAKARSASQVMDIRLKEHEAIRDEAIQAMAVTMLANGNVGAVGDSGEDKKVRRMQSEIMDLRCDMNENLERLRKIQYEPSHVTDLARRQSEGFKDLRRAVTELEKRAVTQQNMYELDNHYVSKKSFVEMEEKFIECAREWSRIEASLTQDQPYKLTEQVSKIQERVDSFSSPSLDVSKLKKRMDEVDGTLNTQGQGLEDLKHAIMGEKDDQGLFELIGKLEEDVNRFRETLNRFNEEIGTLSDDAHGQTARVEALELENSMRDKLPVSSADGELRTSLQNVLSNVTTLSEDLAQLKGDQEIKDELVGQESERLDLSLQDLQSQVSSTRSHFEITISRVNASLSELQTRPVPSAPINTVPTPRSLVDGPERSDDTLVQNLSGTLQEHRRALKQHYGMLQACEAFQISLSQRFDNLTTDRLAQNMVHQMQIMWPNAAEVKAEVDQVKEREGQLKQEVEGLITALDALRRRVGVQDLSGTILAHKDQLAVLTTKFTNLEDRAKDTESTIQSQDRDSRIHYDRIKKLNDDAEKAKEEFAEISEHLKQDIERVGERVGVIERTTIEEIASLHGQLTNLKENCHVESQTQEKDSQEAAVMEDNAELLPDEPTLPTPNGESTAEPEAMVQPEGGQKMRRNRLVTRKEKQKRKRVDSSDSEEDDRSKRRGGEA